MDHRPAEVLFVVLLFFTWLPANVIAATTLALIVAVALYLLRRGSPLKAAIICPVGMWLLFGVAIELNGGIRSPFLGYM